MEQPKSAEQIKAKILLHIFRHDEKERDPSKTDEQIELTAKGKEHAASLKDEGTNIEQSMAFGSPRVRTQETASLVMSGKEPADLNGELLYGKKVVVDERLNFVMPQAGAYYDESMKAFSEGRLLKWLVEESDARMTELGITENVLSYKNQARQIAQLVEKYLKMLPRWQDLVEDKKDENGENKYEPVMERFMGTHQSVSECFLAKVIELTQGVSARDEFVKSLGNQGFGYAQGFEVRISDDPEKPIRIKYGDTFDEAISLETLNQILA